MCSVLMLLDDLHVHLFGLMKRNEMYVCISFVMYAPLPVGFATLMLIYFNYEILRLHVMLNFDIQCSNFSKTDKHLIMAEYGRNM
jgi:hypothetical protein